MESICTTMNFQENSNRARLLYHYRRALDQALSAGVVPRRLWSVFYPLYRVEVEGLQRASTDFEQLELLTEHAIEHAGLCSTAALSTFFGLPSQFISKIVNRLHALGHIEALGKPLKLTS